MSSPIVALPLATSEAATQAAITDWLAFFTDAAAKQALFVLSVNQTGTTKSDRVKSIFADSRLGGKVPLAPTGSGVTATSAIMELYFHFCAVSSTSTRLILWKRLLAPNTVTILADMFKLDKAVLPSVDQQLTAILQQSHVSCIDPLGATALNDLFMAQANGAPNPVVSLHTEWMRFASLDTMNSIAIQLKIPFSTDHLALSKAIFVHPNFASGLCAFVCICVCCIASPTLLCAFYMTTTLRHTTLTRTAPHHSAYAYGR